MENVADRIEAEVITALQELDARWESVGSDDAPWTRAVKNAVGRIGQSLGYRVYGAQCDFEANGEWVFDLSWFEEAAEMVVDMPLALESEWNPRGILDDFQKLLVSRAGHRVLVCWQPSLEAWDECVEGLLDQIRLYRGTQQGDRYLLCCWAGEREPLAIRQHVAC